MPEVIVVMEENQDRPAPDRPPRGRNHQVKIVELARYPVPGNGPSRRALWDGKSDPEEQARKEAERLSKLRGLI